MSLFGKPSPVKSPAPAAVPGGPTPEKPHVYVCKRARLASYLMENGYKPYFVGPNRDNPKYDVFLFNVVPGLYDAIGRFLSQTGSGKNMEKMEDRI